MKRLSETDEYQYQRLASIVVRRNLPGRSEQEREAWIAELVERLAATATEFVAAKRNG